MEPKVVPFRCMVTNGRGADRESLTCPDNTKAEQVEIFHRKNKIKCALFIFRFFNLRKIKNLTACEFYPEKREKNTTIGAKFKIEVYYLSLFNYAIF